MLAGVLLYLALRGANLGEVTEALRQADYLWLIPLVFAIMLSHVLRAWRWQVLLEALPPDATDTGRRKVSLKNAFYALMIGYMVNYALPRVGEVARTADLATHEKISFSSVLGTVVVERILDVVVLALGLTGTFFLLLDQSAAVEEYFLNPIQQQISAIPLGTVLVLALGSTILLVLLYLFGFRAEEAPLRRLWMQHLQPLWTSFKDGLATVLRSPRPYFLVVSTLVIWFCYVLVAYMPLVMFDMAGPYNLSLLDGAIIMFIGAIGVAIPSPGGFGSFHYITRVTLVYLFGVDLSLAVTYGFFVHGGQLVLYVIVGFLCMVLHGSSFGTLLQRAHSPQP